MLKSVSTLKFVGSISLGLLTGISYTLSTITLPTLLTLPSASSASRAFTNLSGRAVTQLRTLATISASSFFLAYILSPRTQKHPYLLWTTLFVTGSSAAEFLLRRISTKAISNQKPREKNGKGRQMDASFEVLGNDTHSEGTASGEEPEGEAEVEVVNGEDVRLAMENFTLSQMVRTALSGIAFAMSVVGIWGDGSTESVIVLEL